MTYEPTQTRPLTSPQVLASEVGQLLDAFADVPALVSPEAMWRFGGLLGDLRCDMPTRTDRPFDALNAVTDRLGGSITPGTAFSIGGHLVQPHEVTAEWHGLRLTVAASIPMADVEQQLRDRIAELEAAQQVSA